MKQNYIYSNCKNVRRECRKLPSRVRG